MTETWLTVGSTQSAFKVVLKRINVARRWRPPVNVHLGGQQQAAGRRRLSAMARRPCGGLGAPRPREAVPGTFQPQAQPVTLPQLGVDQTVQLTLDGKRVLGDLAARAGEQCCCAEMIQRNEAFGQVDRTCYDRS